MVKVKQSYRILVVDDSRLARETIKRMLSRAPEMEVVGEAADAYQAREAIKALSPDALTLDIEMPGMDGLTFLRNLMRLRPMPVVMVSSITQRGAEATLEALDIGAIDFIHKPSGGDAKELGEYADLLIGKLRSAVTVPAGVLELKQQRLTRRFNNSRLNDSRSSNNALTPAAAKLASGYPSLLIAIGASTGGPEALREFITQLPNPFPPILVSLHIPAGFSNSLARRLASLSALDVREAVNGEVVQVSTVYIAPGDRHMRLQKAANGGWSLQVDQGERVNLHRPSVDVLFDSISPVVDPDRVLSILMTGMGKDGVRGMHGLRERGMTTWAQDEASSVVWGMPGEAHKTGAAMMLQPLSNMAEAAIDWVARRARNR